MAAVISCITCMDVQGAPGKYTLRRVFSRAPTTLRSWDVFLEVRPDAMGAALVLELELEDPEQNVIWDSGDELVLANGMSVELAARIRFLKVLDEGQHALHVRINGQLIHTRVIYFHTEKRS